MHKIIALLVALLLSFSVLTGVAMADNHNTNTTPVPCGTPAKPAVYETVRVKIKDAVPAQPAVAEVTGQRLVTPATAGQHYSLAGGAWKTDTPPSFPDPTPADPDDNFKWVANAELEPHTQGNGDPATWTGTTGVGLHFTSAGNSGNTDWFYFAPGQDAVYETYVITPGKPAVPAQDAVYEDRLVLVTPAVPAGPECEKPSEEPTPTVTPEPTDKPEPPRNNPEPPVKDNTPDKPVAVPTAVAAGAVASELPEAGAVDFTAGLLAGAGLVITGGLLAYRRRRGTREV